MGLKKVLLVFNLALVFLCITSFSCLAGGGKFTEDEDQTLSLYARHLGKNDDWEINNWDDVAQKLNEVYGKGRTARQCRERYDSYLSGKNHSPMSEDEIKLLKSLVEKQGTKWEKFVTNYFPGRTIDQLKSAYSSSNKNDDVLPIITVGGFSYDRFSNPSIAGHCFWNIMRKHMQNIPNADIRLQEIAQEIGATFNDYFDHFKLSSFFEKMNEKGYKVWYSLVTADWNHPEDAMDNGISVPPELGDDVPIIRLALFGNFGYEGNVDARGNGHYVEAEGSNFQLEASDADCAYNSEQPGCVPNGEFGVVSVDFIHQSTPSDFDFLMKNLETNNNRFAMDASIENGPFASILNFSEDLGAK